MNEAGKRRLSKNLKISLISLIGLCLVAICCIALLFVEPRDREATPTPTLQSIETIILQTSDAAAIQTQNASSPTPNSTPTFLPTLTQPATLAVIDTLIPPSTILPFNPPTATTFILPTNPPPSGGGGNAICSCSGDLYNCTTDFTTHAQAQTCYEYCTSQGVGDIHQLDGNDHDGLACESLP